MVIQSKERHGGEASCAHDQTMSQEDHRKSQVNFVTFDDLEQPLTPAHLLSGRQLLSLPDSVLYQGWGKHFNIG